MMHKGEQSLGGEATCAGRVSRPHGDMSLGNERTLGGGDASGIDTLIDDIEVVALEPRYRIDGTLGQGGMGAVLLATDTRLGRKVAIKRILGEAARSKTAVMRFLTEAKAIAALNHPNIVQIFDYGRAKDGPFLIMEFVDGGSLADRCKQGGLPLEEAVTLACQLCDGLAKAHNAGIVHRDIKPANVLLNRDGLPKLTDFGLAKAEATDHGMTMTGAVMGTPDFMPPEQRKDAALVDHRSDLWSLAATVYQMVTGRSPKIIRLNDVPANLQDVLAKALEEAKEARYQSAREFREALTNVGRAGFPVVGILKEGQCLSCGAQNDTSRKFCRGCGGAMEAPCFACETSMPIWEEICGSCGAKQTPLADELRADMAARQAQAEACLKDLDFDQAENISVLLRNQNDLRLNHLQPWATAFLAQISNARKEQSERTKSLFSEALRHEQAFDYQSGLHALGQIPDIFRNRSVDDQQETPTQFLHRLADKQARSIELENKIKAALATRTLGGLLVDVEALLVLRPDRPDLLRLKTQLLERQQTLEHQRDRIFADAKQLFESQEYSAAIAALKKVDASVETPEVALLLQQAERSQRSVESLVATIKAALAAKRHDGLLAPVNELLTLKSQDDELAKLRTSLLMRDEKLREEVAGVVRQAALLQQNCHFAEAATLLDTIPTQRRTRDVVQLRDSCVDMAKARIAMLGAIAKSRGHAFAFEAIDAFSGAEIRQSIRADSESDAKSQIAAMGYMLTKIKQGNVGEFVDDGQIVPALEKYRSLLELAGLSDQEFVDAARPLEEVIAKQRQAQQEAAAKSRERKAARAATTNVAVIVAVTAGCGWAISHFARERFDAKVDDVVLRWLPIAALVVTWLWFLRRQLRRKEKPNVAVRAWFRMRAEELGRATDENVYHRE